MRTFRHRSTVLGAAATTVLALALTACGGSDSGTKDAGAAKSDAPTVSSTQAAGSAPSAASATSAVTGGSAKDAGSGNGGSAKADPAATVAAASAVKAKGGGSTNTESYAFSHPCETGRLSLRVTTRSGASSQRVIEVRNTGSTSCGLSYHPAVDLGDSASGDRSHNVKPLIPSGLGGAPAYPVLAGQTAYAVIDLNPSGATTGTAPGINEMNVLVSPDSMPNADTRNFPLGSGAKVLKPKLGLYRGTVADAVNSMKQADTQS
ncbi:DUF4232 domain-containing protein [Streptomyces sp. AM 4-1-1]|uniref:DUF4232 domain-containing protein n=1 Tax=Streptomyces sp. AM 4-1-1 TaxID=3028710 RepID=UPI0023B905DD|nr:DUF4232 domain-containing protein [Streptomyces sp. AM 4-1-1]WEH35489.1 DUF4232 domain-containing protein [Streptomyces sp. AM 4-1-1]